MDGPEPVSRRRNQTACEACRATKIRCQPSDQPGVCRRCLDSKTECVLRSTPRPRRSRRAPTHQAERPSPSTTFTIDFAVPIQQDPASGLDLLRLTHEQEIDNFFPPEDDLDYDYPSFEPPSSSSPSIQTPSSLDSTQSRSIESLHGQPQFSLSSAEYLLATFRPMLAHFPCILLPEDATVRQLADTRPFVLLSILATTAGTRNVQSYSLYDEEFRKVLSLKFVAGGERTLDLLQGILIYCAWYPFHLRPKTKQVCNYIRMASDLITDLDLDTTLLDDPSSTGPITEHQLDAVRSYLAHCYFSKAFAVGWCRYKNLEVPFTSWTTTCCEMLEQNARADSDLTLTQLVRQSSIARDAALAIQDKDHHQRRILLLGLEAQARDLRQTTPLVATPSVPLRIGSLFIEIYIHGGGLLLPRGQTNLADSKLSTCSTLLATFFAEITQLDTSILNCFTAVEWGRLVLAIITAFRLSLPIPSMPSFDHRHAREEIRLSDFLDHMCHETASQADVLSANRIIMDIVKRKFRRQVEMADSKEASQGPRIPSCPMLDGSLEEYLPLWDASLPIPLFH